MRETKKYTINVAKVLAPIIGSRDVVKVLERTVLKTKTKMVDLDFSDVQFVSRSAAHALLVLREDLQRRMIKQKFVNFINPNTEVKEMFRIVAANRAVPKSSETEVHIDKTDILSLVKFSY